MFLLTDNGHDIYVHSSWRNARKIIEWWFVRANYSWKQNTDIQTFENLSNSEMLKSHRVKILCLTNLWGKKGKNTANYEENGILKEKNMNNHSFTIFQLIHRLKINVASIILLSLSNSTKIIPRAYLSKSRTQISFILSGSGSKKANRFEPKTTKSQAFKLKGSWDTVITRTCSDMIG